MQCIGCLHFGCCQLQIPFFFSRFEEDHDTADYLFYIVCWNTFVCLVVQRSQHTFFPNKYINPFVDSHVVAFPDPDNTVLTWTGEICFNCSYLNSQGLSLLFTIITTSPQPFLQLGFTCSSSSCGSSSCSISYFPSKDYCFQGNVIQVSGVDNTGAGFSFSSFSFNECQLKVPAYSTTKGFYQWLPTSSSILAVYKYPGFNMIPFSIQNLQTTGCMQC